jgi:hypothetical protein
MAIGDDFSVAVNGDIRHTGGATTYTVLEFHRWLQDLADDAEATGDDIMAISYETPSDRSTDNIITLVDHSASGGPTFNIDAGAAEYLYDGSISQRGGDEVYAGLVVVGSVVAGTEVIIIQNNALVTDTWTTKPNADAGANIILRNLVRTRADGADIDGQRLIVQAREFGDTYAEFLVTMALGNNTAALFTSTDLNNATAEATVGAWTITNTEGYQELDVTGDGTGEPYYSQWDRQAQSINDLYEFTKRIQRRSTAETIHGMNGSLFRGITHEWAYTSLVNDAPATNDLLCWGAFLDTGVVTGGPFQVGEKITGDTSGAVGRVLSVDATNTSLVVSTESGTWQAEGVTGFVSGATATTAAPVGQATGGGVGTVLAIDTTGLEIWIQLAKGTPPANSTVCYRDADHTDTTTTNSATTARTVSAEFVGTSTGSAIIGAFGIGLKTDTLTNSDQLFDLDNVQRQPPNNVTFEVSGLQSGEDYVLVGPENGSGGLDLDQFTTDLAYTGSTSTIQVSPAIPSDTPSSGTIRIQRDSGIYSLLDYTSYSGDVFTLTASEDFTSDNASLGNNVFISYIDKLSAGATESFTTVFNTPRTLFVRVRDGDTTPIKTFETTATLGAGGGSTSVIRQSDT